MAITLEISGNATKEAYESATANGVRVANFVVASDGGTKDNPQTTFVKVAVYANGKEGEKFDSAMKVETGDFVAVRGKMTKPSLSKDGKYINFGVSVSETNVFSFISRYPKKEDVSVNGDREFVPDYL